MLSPWRAILAQQLDPSGIVRIVIASGILVLLLLLGFLVVARLRRRLQEPDAPAAGAGFTLADLRQLHKNGQMSTEEFERAKAKVVENAKRAAERDAQRSRQPGTGRTEARRPSAGDSDDAGEQ